MPRPSDFHRVRHQANLMQRDTARLAIESCDYLLALPNIEKAGTFATTLDPVAANHLHRFANAWGLRVVDKGDFLALAGVRGTVVSGRDAKRYIESHRVRCQKKLDVATREIDRGFARYGLPACLGHAVDVVA